ncbi:amidase family protein, partial [Streptomyces griseus]|uniref:amidase family protein n=1 Tax=Streptomyces griseus TaxID=1911 RepID=UPI0033D1AE8A
AVRRRTRNPAACRAVHRGAGSRRTGNLSGHPAASLPAGFTGDGCPVGLQLAAARGADVRLLAAARAVEGALPAAPSPPTAPNR